MEEKEPIALGDFDVDEYDPYGDPDNPPIGDPMTFEEYLEWSRDL